MAKEAQAAHAKEKAPDYLQREVGVRPYAVGITEPEPGDFGLSVSFPRAPNHTLPPTVMGVPVEYYIGEQPQLMGARRARKKLTGWRAKLQALGE